MRILSFTGAALIAAMTGAPALAADVIVEEAVASEAYNWSGAYVGIEVGYARGDSTAEYDLTVPPGSTEIDPDGGLAGVYVGYNYQMPNNLVLGIDADIAYTDIDGRGQFISDGGAPIAGSFDSLELNWSAAVRGRIGYAIGRFLPYFAAGVAFSDVDQDTDDANPLFVGSWSETYVGYTVGAGAEYAATDKLIFRGEYRYTDFGSETFTATQAESEHDVDLETHDVRVGIAYKF